MSVTQSITAYQCLMEFFQSMIIRWIFYEHDNYKLINHCSCAIKSD